MPLRDFRCQTCDQKTEQLIGHNEPDPTKCEACGADGDDGLVRDETPPKGIGVAFGPGFFKTGGY